MAASLLTFYPLRILLKGSFGIFGRSRHFVGGVFLVLRIKLQNQKWHCPKQYHTRMKEKISILAKCSVFMVMMFQIYFWSTNEYSHTDPLSHARQNFTIKSSSKNPPGNRSKSPVVEESGPPDVIKSPKNLPAVKKKAVLLISRYRNQFIMILPIVAG